MRFASMFRSLFLCYDMGIVMPGFLSFFRSKYPKKRWIRVLILVLVLAVGIPLIWMAWMTSSYYIQIQRGTGISPKQKLLQRSIASKVANVTANQEDLARLVPQGNVPKLGGDQAPVSVVLFVDYQCPYTKESMPAIRTVMDHIGDRAQLVIRDFPIVELHPEARDVAHAARCVLEQGQKAYWRYQELLFAQQDTISSEVLRQLASTASVNVARFEECMVSRRYDLAIDQDLAFGERVGVSGTPTFFVNGAKFEGSVDEELFTKAINYFLE